MECDINRQADSNYCFDVISLNDSNHNPDINSFDDSIINNSTFQANIEYLTLRYQ